MPLPTLLLLLLPLLSHAQQNFCANSTPFALPPLLLNTWSSPAQQVSTNAPGTYANNAACTITLTAPPGFVIALRLASFATEANVDFLRFFDGASTSAPLLASYSGALPKRDLLTSRPVVTLEFKSNYQTGGGGAVVRFQLLPQAQLSSLAPSTALAAGEVRALTTNAGPTYANSASVTTVFTAPAGYVISLVVQALALQPGPDAVAVYDGASAAAPPLATLTGAAPPPELLTSGASLTLVFATDAATVLAGAHIVLTALPLVDFCASQAPLTLSATPYSPAGGSDFAWFPTVLGLATNALAATYPAPASCTITITAPAAAFPAAQVSAYAADPTVALAFFDGSGTASAQQLTAGAGTAQPPWSAMGSAMGGALTVVFSSTSASPGAGVRLTLAAAQPTPISFCPGPGAAPAYFVQGQTLRVASNLGASYGANANCQLQVAVPLGYVIVTRAMALNLDGGVDYVGVFDGTSTSAPLLGKAHALPFTDVITSRANATLQFYSNYQNQNSGAQLLLSMVRQPAICDTPTVALAAGQVLPFSTQRGAAYANAASCATVVTAPAGHAIAVTFQAVNLERGADFLTLYDGASTSTSPLLLPAITGTELPALISTSGAALTLSFTTSLTTAFSGAQLLLQAVPQRNLCADQTPIALGLANYRTSADTLFATSVGLQVPITTTALGSNYAVPASCTVTVTAASGYLPFFHSTQHALDAASALDIFDGASTASANIATGSTTAPWDAGGGALSGALTVRFTAPAGATASAGARFTLSSVQPTPICPSPAAPLYFVPGQTLRVSTNLGGSYGVSQNCVLNVGVPLGWVIAVRFNSVSLDGGADHVSVYDGTSTSAPLLGQAYALPFTDVITSRANVTLAFYSNYQNVGPGAHITLSMIRQPSICDSTSASITLAPNQVLPFTTNMGALYANSQTCTSIVSAPAGYAVGLEVQALSLEAGSDFLRLFDGPTTSSSSLLPPVSGTILPGTIASSGATLTLQFFSSLTTAFSGAHMLLVALPQRNMCADQTPIVLGSSNLITSTSTLAFSSGINWLVPITTNAVGSNYAVPGSCTLTVTAPAGYIAQMHITSYSADALASFDMFDGATAAANKVATGSSTAPWDGAGGAFGGPVTVRFTAQAGSTALAGARLTISSVQPTPICPSPAAPLYFVPGQTLRVSTNLGGSYGVSQNCVLNVGVPLGWVIAVRFNSVSLDGGADHVSVYDGTSTSAPLLGQAYALPFTDVITSRANVTLAFYSNYQNVGPGAHITLSMIRQPSICDPASTAIALTPGQVLPFTTNTLPAYANFANCLAQVTAPAGYAVGISVVALSTQAPGDWVEVYDGPTYDSPLLLPTLTGAPAPFLPPDAVSSSPVATLLFITDAATADTGVHMLLRAVPVMDICAASGGTLTLGPSQLALAVAGVATATGPSYPMAGLATSSGPAYAAPGSCALAITTTTFLPAGTLPALRLGAFSADVTSSFTMRDGGVGAPQGALLAPALAGTGGASGAPLGGVGSAIAGTVTVRFTTTAPSSPGLPGAALAATQVTPINMCRGLPAATVPAGGTLAFSTSSLPAAYTNSLSCAQTVTASDPGYLLFVRVLMASTEANFDVFSVRDGPTTAAPTIYSVSGSPNLAANPANGTSTGASLTLVFTTNYAVIGAGVLVSVRAVANPQWVFSVTPSRRPTPSSSATLTASPTGASASNSPSSTGTGTVTPSGAPSPSGSDSGTPSHAAGSDTPSATPTGSETPTPSSTFSTGASASATATGTPSGSATPSGSPSASAAPSAGAPASAAPPPAASSAPPPAPSALGNSDQAAAALAAQLGAARQETYVVSGAVGGVALMLLLAALYLAAARRASAAALRKALFSAPGQAPGGGAPPVGVGGAGQVLLPMVNPLLSAEVAAAAGAAAASQWVENTDGVDVWWVSRITGESVWELPTAQ